MRRGTYYRGLPGEEEATRVKLVTGSDGQRAQ